MFNATQGLTVKTVFSYKVFTLNEANTYVARVRALSSCYYKNNGLQTAVVEILGYCFCRIHHTWLDNYGKISNKFMKTALTIIDICKH
jgi:hypothetical protein